MGENAFNSGVFRYDYDSITSLHKMPCPLKKHFQPCSILDNQDEKKFDNKAC